MGAGTSHEVLVNADKYNIPADERFFGFVNVCVGVSFFCIPMCLYVVLTDLNV